MDDGKPKAGLVMSLIATTSSELSQPQNMIQEDMAKLKSLLQDSLSPHVAAGQKDMRILNLACGRCDEAETLIQLGSDLTQGGAVEMVGADIRIREIRQARETHSHLPADFLIEDATKISEHKQLGDDFNMVFVRHQNFWHGQELWKKIFDQGIAKLRPDGMLVITSYFDVEHRLALRALEAATAPTDEDGLREMRAQYYGMISDVDQQLGRVWEALRELGQWENTIVIVTSDHGEQLGDHGMVQKMGWFEESFHIPLIVRDPRSPETAGSIVEVFTEAVDVFPTVCELLALDVPRQCDGRSLRPFLAGEVPEEWRDAAYWEFDWRFFTPGRDGAKWPQDRRSVGHQLTVRRSDDVAYVQFADGEALVYDVSADPTWRTMLDDPERAWAEARSMLAWRAQHTDRTLTGTFLP